MVEEPDTVPFHLRGIKENTKHIIKVQIGIICRRIITTHITNRFLPKAIDLMDEAASKLRMEINSKPRRTDVLDRKIMQRKSKLKPEKDDPN
jgi:ATP-dependent Clp protease ATP-binding subunit ClpB